MGKNKEKNKDFCCEIMKGHGLSGKEIDYDISIRRYALILINDEYGTHHIISFCPWCGSKLPKPVGEIRAKILKEEYNIEDPYFDDADRVPEEFKTDAWWKKRGL